jgi:chromosomal replication initiation ATPase DnaA
MLGSSHADLRPHSWRHYRRLAPFLTNHHLCRMVEQAVAPTFGVPRERLWNRPKGRRPEVFARQVAMYLVHVECGLSLTEVGRLFGRDRTTVAHACAVVEDRRDDMDFDRAMDLLGGILLLLSPRLA